MRRVDIQIPSEIPCYVTGFLYTSEDFGELGQDMLEVALDNGILIEAGWYPEAQPHGSYVVSVTRGFDLQIQPIKVDDVFAAVELVQNLISTFGGKHLIQTSTTTDTREKVYI